MDGYCDPGVLTGYELDEDVGILECWTDVEDEERCNRHEVPLAYLVDDSWHNDYIKKVEEIRDARREEEERRNAEQRAKDERRERAWYEQLKQKYGI